MTRKAGGKLEQLFAAQEKSLPPRKNNFGDLSDFVSQEAATAKATEERDEAIKERDEARAKCVELAKALQRFQTASTVPAPADDSYEPILPSIELIVDYQKAKDRMRSLRSTKSSSYAFSCTLEYQQVALRAQAMASVIADIVAGEPENPVTANLIAQDDARRRAFAVKKSEDE